MSNGRRRPKLSRASLRPADSGLIKEGRVAKQRTRATLIGSVVVSMRHVRGRSSMAPGPPFTYRIGQRPDRELRVNVKEFRIRNQTKTSNERQAAADQVPPSLDQRSRPDPGAGRAARRPDHRGGEIGSIGRPARKRASRLEAESRELSRPQGGHRYPRAPRQPARSDRRRFRALAPRRRAGARTLCLPTKNRAGCCRFARRASRGRLRGWCRAIGWFPNGSSSPRARSIKSSARLSLRRGSARSSLA